MSDDRKSCVPKGGILPRFTNGSVDELRAQKLAESLLAGRPTHVGEGSRRRAVDNLFSFAPVDGVRLNRAQRRQEARLREMREGAGPWPQSPLKHDAIERALVASGYDKLDSLLYWTGYAMG